MRRLRPVVHRDADCLAKPDTLPLVTIRTVATLLTLAVVLPACTTEEKVPTVLPPAPSTSPTPTASRTPVPTRVPIPPEATAETSQGASAFAAYYLKLVEDAFATADPQALKEASAPGCGGCDALIGSVDGLRRQGHKRIGGNYVVREALAPAIVDGDVVVDIAYERPAGRVIDTSGTVLETADPVPLTTAQMRLIRRDQTWVVQGYRVVET